eukprot:4057508-Pleurochrysis_carterae.AAC.1
MWEGHWDGRGARGCCAPLVAQSARQALRDSRRDRRFESALLRAFCASTLAGLVPLRPLPFRLSPSRPVATTLRDAAASPRLPDA